MAQMSERKVQNELNCNPNRFKPFKLPEISSKHRRVTGAVVYRPPHEYHSRRDSGGPPSTFICGQKVRPNDFDYDVSYKLVEPRQMKKVPRFQHGQTIMQRMDQMEKLRLKMIDPN